MVPRGVDQINMNPKCRLGGSCQKGVDALSILGDFVLTILPEVGQNARAISCAISLLSAGDC